jgi:hypothetical protein
MPQLSLRNAASPKSPTPAPHLEDKPRQSKGKEGTPSPLPPLNFSYRNEFEPNTHIE